MPTLRLSSFDGIVPRTSPTMLGENQATVANNVKLYARELRAWRSSLLAETASAPTSIYKLYNMAGAHTWLKFANDVDVALSPINDNGEARFYYTGDGSPRKSTYAMVQSGFDYYEIGVPAPVNPPSLTLSVTGTGTQQTRAYLFTNVAQFGSVYEESAPSPPETITLAPLNSTVTINGLGTAPAGDYNIVAQRIYRSVTGSSTSSYQFVAEVAVDGSYADDLTTLELGSVLETLGWREPPDDLEGIVTLASGSGVLAGFSGNTVCFSEPFYPHAWPIAYQIAIPGKIVGLGVFGSSLVVTTDSYPYIINGGTPGSMSVERIPILEPCVSKKSIASDVEGVLYASPNGLIAIGPNGRGVATKNLYRREEWTALAPENMAGAVLDGRYYGISGGTAIVLDKGDIPALSTLDVDATVMHVGRLDAKLYFVSSVDGDIYELEGDGTDYLTYEWRSKRWRLPQGVTFSALRVDADFAALEDVDASLEVKLYGDGVLMQTFTPESLDPIRVLPFRSRELEIEIVGNITVRELTLATTVKELRQ